MFQIKRYALSFKFIIFIIILLLLPIYNINENKITNYLKDDNEIIKKEKINQTAKYDRKIINNKKCYINLDNSNLAIIHLIFTRFMMDFNLYKNKDLIYEDVYIFNGIRVMKKYLFPSLENQSCKNFTWILLLGDKANITNIESLVQLNQSFDSKVIYRKDLKNYLKFITKDYNILITTRIDYDDAIYYDAVNDVRKVINVNKPIIAHGYNRGVSYYEINGKYYDFYNNWKNEGVMSVFASLIVNLKKVNDTYTIFDTGCHYEIRKNILNWYKRFGIKDMNYEPAVFDNGDPKFIYVRQKFSGSYKMLIPKINPRIFDLNKFYGKYFE